MSGLSLTVSDELLDELADLLAPRVLSRLDGIEPDAPAPVAYTIATLAESLGVSEKVIRGAIHRGAIPAQRRGRRYLIALEAAHA
jgi:excisionase family DNA binding protein